MSYGRKKQLFLRFGRAVGKEMVPQDKAVHLLQGKGNKDTTHTYTHIHTSQEMCVCSHIS